VIAAVTTFAGSGEQLDRGLELAREVLPWTREETGFCGFLALLGPEEGRAVAITLWSDRRALEAHEVAASEVRALIGTGAGVELVSRHVFEVGAIDLPSTAA
jgi:quinol monooxygenase YgiN